MEGIVSVIYATKGGLIICNRARRRLLAVSAILKPPKCWDATMHATNKNYWWSHSGDIRVPILSPRVPVDISGKSERNCVVKRWNFEKKRSSRRKYNRAEQELKLRFYESTELQEERKM